MAAKITSKLKNKRETDIKTSKTHWINKIHSNTFFDEKPEADQVTSKKIGTPIYCQKDIRADNLNSWGCNLQRIMSVIPL